MAIQMPPMHPGTSPDDRPDETPTDSDYEYEHFEQGIDEPGWEEGEAPEPKDPADPA